MLLALFGLCALFRVALYSSEHCGGPTFAPTWTAVSGSTYYLKPCMTHNRLARYEAVELAQLVMLEYFPSVAPFPPVYAQTPALGGSFSKPTFSWPRSVLSPRTRSASATPASDKRQDV